MSKTLLLAVGEDIAALEEEICEYRRTKLHTLAPSAFSYHLYEVKLAALRTEWELCKKGVLENPDLNFEKDEIREKLETLLYERMAEVKKQNDIQVDDFPENEEFQKMKMLHAFRMENVYKTKLRLIGIDGWDIFEK